MTSKTMKTILFASVIAALILPFSAMNLAEGIIGEAQLHVMKPSAYLINIARGELIDEDALVKALREGWIAGAALDVYRDEFQKPPPDDFWELPNLILTPHVSGGTDVPINDLAELFYENLTRFVSGSELINVIDWERGY